MKCNDYTIANLLDYLYHKKHYWFRFLARQTNATISVQISFTKKLEQDDGATIFFIAEKQQKTILRKQII